MAEQLELEVMLRCEFCRQAESDELEIAESLLLDGALCCRDCYCERTPARV